MRPTDRRLDYVNRPPLSDETSWVRTQLRVVKRLIQLHHQRNPLMADNPDYYLGTLMRELGVVPQCGMLAFWMVALRGRDKAETVNAAWLRMYTTAEDGVSFRRVAFAGYKANRSYVPRGRGNRP